MAPSFRGEAPFLPVEVLVISDLKNENMIDWRKS